ncbi:putative toxin-antitoxin system toxin component, PIN family [Deinococcus sp.]|uniref:putative toxin-antitoxin system toxin component, PIN family n=1 Tax=Deinococcus sp. TaxID=47478 RepID=UPI0025D20663|nr:putative toxin-antitoxin system toxin component, PIN family [Deinococcus sp.]
MIQPRLEPPATLRLIPDINVILSGATSRVGPAVDLFRAAQTFEVVFVLAEEHFTELTQVLTYPQVLRLGVRRLTPSAAFHLASVLYRCAEYYSRLDRQTWPSCPDPKDWYLLDLLMTSDADALVTKDRHLLRAGDKLGLPIFEPKNVHWSSALT